MSRESFVPLKHPLSLRYFFEVAKAGSFRKASAQVHVAASAINRHVKHLEEEMGSPLFERGRGREGLRLTAAGEILLYRLKRAMTELGAAGSEIDALQGLRRGTVNFGANEGIWREVLPGVLTQFRSDHPGIQYHVVTAHSPRLVEMVLADEVDFALAFNPPPHESLTLAAKLNVGACVMVRRNHPLASRRALRLRDCAQYELVMPDESLALRGTLDKMFAQAGLAPQVALTTNSYEVMRLADGGRHRRRRHGAGQLRRVEARRRGRAQWLRRRRDAQGLPGGRARLKSQVAGAPARGVQRAAGDGDRHRRLHRHAVRAGAGAARPACRRRRGAGDRRHRRRRLGGHRAAGEARAQGGRGDRQGAEAGYLKRWAPGIIDRNELSAPGKPLQKERWAAVVDAVGSHTLANACAQTRYGGAVAACGLAQGLDLPATRRALHPARSVGLDVEDYLDYFVDDPSTRLACLFLETVRRPDRLAAAAARMRAAGKPVVVLKVGRTAMGAAASAAHTGSLASSHTAASEFFRHAGIVVVDDLDELVEACTLFDTLRKPPANDGLGVINISGGEVALTCDLGQELGLHLPPLGAATTEALSAVLPAFATPANPLDATSAALSDPQVYQRSMRALLDDPAIGLVAVSQDCPSGLSDGAARGYSKLAQSAAEVARTAAKPMVFYSNVAGPLHPVTIEPLRGTQVPVLQGARPALVAIRSYLEWHRWTPAPAAQARGVQAQPAWRTRLADGTPLSENEAKRFLQDHGVRTTRETPAATAEAAVRAAQEIGFPVVLKVDSADIAHKSDVGGVALSLNDAAAVAQAFDRVLHNVRQHRPDAKVDGVVVQEMVVGGVELIVGSAQHRPFGPGIVVGAGGVLVELMNDSAFALAPVSAAQARQLVGRTRASRLLDGYRGAPPADRHALEAVVVRVSDIAQAYADVIEAIELNPVAVLREGQGACALDALIVPCNP
jgi:acyl-CoA synthetase (NDP forming)/DNA-binding transcriptional LysR family regulator